MLSHLLELGLKKASGPPKIGIEIYHNNHNHHQSSISKSSLSSPCKDLYGPYGPHMLRKSQPPTLRCQWCCLTCRGRGSRKCLFNPISPTEKREGWIKLFETFVGIQIYQNHSKSSKIIQNHHSHGPARICMVRMAHKCLENHSPPPCAANGAVSPVVAETLENVRTPRTYQQKNGKGGSHWIKHDQTI